VGLGEPVDSVPFAALSADDPVERAVAFEVAVGTSSRVLVSVVWLTDTAAVSWAKDEDTFEEEPVVSLTISAAAVGVTGYICASRTMTSAGRSLYHCGAALPVGRVASVAVGIAVFRTDSTESLVGSIVAGSMARAIRSATAWRLGCVEDAMALVAMMLAERIVDSFMIVASIDMLKEARVRNIVCGPCVLLMLLLLIVWTNKESAVK
jgi:hypothetical protein